MKEFLFDLLFTEKICVPPDLWMVNWLSIKGITSFQLAWSCFWKSTTQAFSRYRAGSLKLRSFFRSVPPSCHSLTATWHRVFPLLGGFLEVTIKRTIKMDTDAILTSKITLHQLSKHFFLLWSLSEKRAGLRSKNCLFKKSKEVLISSVRLRKYQRASNLKKRSTKIQVLSARCTR